MLTGHDEQAALDVLEGFILQNNDLLALEERLGRFNIFDALGLARAEIRHSNFLAWLLDPAESHGQGQFFLKGLLEDILRSVPRGARPLSVLELHNADLRGVEVRREWERIDLLITCEEPRFGIVIENKIGSSEHGSQLYRYMNAYRNRYTDRPAIFVYLTASGEGPSCEGWFHYTYADVFRVLERCRNTQAGSIGDDVRVVLDHYLRLIGSRFMNDANIEKLCRDIYRKHRQALDLIYDVVGEKGETARLLEEMLRADEMWHVFGTTGRRVDFTPREWAEITPPLCTLAGQDRRFWIRCWLRTRAHGIYVIVEIGPCEDEDLRAEVIQRLSADPASGLRARGKLTKNWTRLLREPVLEWDEDEDDPSPDHITEKAKQHLKDLHKRLAPATETLRQLFGRGQT